MKQAQIKKYSEKGEILFNNTALNSLKDDEVLITVKVAGLNPVDNMIKKGEMKILFSYQFPLT